MTVITLQRLFFILKVKYSLPSRDRHTNLEQQNMPQNKNNTNLEQKTIKPQTSKNQLIKTPPVINLPDFIP